MAQVSGVREQAILTQAIRSELKTQGVLGHPEVTMTALSPVWLDSRSRYLRDMYRPGMVMEQWNPETRSHDRYVIDRVTGKIPGLRVSGGDRLQVASVSEDAMTVVVPGRAEPATLPVADSPFTALEAGERLGGNARAFRQRQCDGFCLRHTDGNGQCHPERSGPQWS